MAEVKVIAKDGSNVDPFWVIVNQGGKIRWKNPYDREFKIVFAKWPFEPPQVPIKVPRRGYSKTFTVCKDRHQRVEKQYPYKVIGGGKPPVAGPKVIVPPPPPPPPPGKKYVSDYIIGKRGDSLRGKVLTKQFIVSTAFGRITLKTKDIAYIHFDRPKKGVDDIWLHNGDRLGGRVQNKTIEFRPHWGDERKIPTSIIHTVIIGASFNGREKSL